MQILKVSWVPIRSFSSRPPKRKSTLTLAVLSLLLISACMSDQLVTSGSEQIAAPAGPQQPRKSLSETPSSGGFVSADLSLKASQGWKRYKSARIPLQTVKANGKVVIPAHVISQLGQSMSAVPLVGRIDPRVFLASSTGERILGLASASVDPETDLDNFAAANPVANQGEVINVPQPDWEMLTGDSYAEDIGNGTVLQIILDPISSVNPNGLVRGYLNGRQVATINPQHQAESSGWMKHTSNQATYAFETGEQTSSGTHSTGGGGAPPPPLETSHDGLSPWTPNAKEGYDIHREHPRLAFFLDKLLPARAYAAAPEPCYYYLRQVAISVAGMIWSARRGNVQGYIISHISAINGVYEFAACMERNRRRGYGR